MKKLKEDLVDTELDGLNEGEENLEGEGEIIETVEFKFNRNVNLGGVLVNANETVEVTFSEAKEFEVAQLGEAKW